MNWDADLEQTWTCCSGARSEKPATDLAKVTIVLTKWVIRALRSDWLNSESLPWNQNVWLSIVGNTGFHQISNTYTYLIAKKHISLHALISVSAADGLASDA